MKPMNLINDYFEFKKRNLINYAAVFIDDNENTLEYLRKYIDTYVDTYYYHILNTYYDESVKKFDGKIIIKELKGKKLELLDELDETKKDEDKLINKCYKYGFIAVIIDVINFNGLTKVEEFKEMLRETLVEKRKLMEYDDGILDKLASIVRNSVLKERRFFSSLNNDNFKVNFYRYKDSHTYNKVVLDFDIESLSKNYTVDVLEKNYKSDRIKLLKFEATMNMLMLEMLKKILSNDVIDYYFVDVPTSTIKDKTMFERLVSYVDNNRLKNNIVFVVNYNEYIQNKSLFKNLEGYSFALCIDLSRTIVIEKRLSEIEGFDLFHYVIIDGVKQENLQLVENYVIKGKVMFMNELNVM